jgi:hypothetical protein
MVTPSPVKIVQFITNLFFFVKELFGHLGRGVVGLATDQVIADGWLRGIRKRQEAQESRNEVTSRFGLHRPIIKIWRIGI